MAKPTLLFFPFTLLSFCVLISAAVAKSPSTDFIKQKCDATSFPDLCAQSLSLFAAKIQRSPRQLAQTALTVSLSRGRAAKAHVAKLYKSKGLRPREKAALQDCAEEMGDMVDRLGKSTREFHRAGRAGGHERRWRISNVQTWVSAGLTDQNTCLDGFSSRALNGKVKDSVRARVLDAVHCTSNSLALINQYVNGS
ncbi:hypothetical protein V2J09_014512 [Rumex salicifolius]